jgi:hypothetical protein
MIWVTVPSVAGTVACPHNPELSSAPQQFAIPASSTAHVWDQPAAICTMFVSGGTVLCPAWFPPQQVTPPTSSTAQV